MLSNFLMIIAFNMTFMYLVDVALNKRFHKPYFLHWLGGSIGLIVLCSLLHFFPQYDWKFVSDVDGYGIIKVLAAVFLFDTFVYFVHKYIEHGPLLRFHKVHHGCVYDNDLTYYSPAPEPLVPTLYYVGIQIAICSIVGADTVEMAIILTWIYQQGAYLHQKGLPELPWPLLGPSHHRSHHYNAKKYYSGLFLFWDKVEDIEPRAIFGMPDKDSTATS